MIVKQTFTRIIDTKRRLTIPDAVMKECGLKIGDSVYFDVTKSGNVVIKVYKPK